MDEDFVFCPFCGGKPHVHDWGRGYVRMYNVECTECGTDGPAFTSYEEAKEHWNERV